ncbi:MAG: prephenate dehydrogenase/arogenate dehydrogenase family protein [Lachnospiraceae bacterium]|nr:prephenate dehydrogenase/arogenate dehydrogenase family protein [Lachnospiraceae bacterium]
MKKIDTSKKFLIIGLGLLGGCYAKALKKKGFSVAAITREQADIDYAVAEGIIDKGSVTPDRELIEEADIMVFALYPHTFVEWIREYGELIKEGCVLTDVTGVKGCIVYEIQSMLKPGVEFIAAHPMAGREVSGVRNSDESIFHGANYIVVPTDKNTFGAIELCKELGQLLGFARVSVLNPEKHDEMIAFLSQLTHCIAVSLMCANDNPGLVFYTGDSFRDLTRIANINDEMWSELFLANREALLKEMEKYRNTFDKLYNCVKNNDREEMRSMMRISTERRGEFNKKNRE